MPNDKAAQDALLAAVAQTTGGTVSLRREGRVVHLSLTNADDYTAIELYERLMVSLRRGELKLELKLL